jgi:hypothetical protein
MLTDEKLRQVARLSSRIAPEAPEASVFVEVHFGIMLPETLKRIHRLGGGASVLTQLEDGVCFCDFHALRVSPFTSYGSDIIAAYERLQSQLNQSREAFRRVIPFGQDGGGGQFCLDYRSSSEPHIALCNWDYRLIARSFDEFIDRALPERKSHWSIAPHAISKAEQREFTAQLPDTW